MRRDAAARLAGLVAALAFGLAASPATAQTPTPPPVLESATLEELMGISVTSAGRKAQRAEDVAAAIFVITREQIRQSGLRTLPEILRLAPGVQVARAGSNKWAVSVRGFNDVYSNKLLILVDGRSVYNRAFSGVFWESQDVLIDEIERIEVIRGPGGALWGANAATGILNIITRHAGESAGGAIELGAGDFDRSRVNFRYGGALGPVAYRVFSQWSTYGDSLADPDTPANDRWVSLATGFRADWAGERDALMATGQFTAGRSRPRWVTMTSLAPPAFAVSDAVTDTREVSAVARWTHTMAGGSVLQLQGTHSRSDREETALSAIEQSSGADLQVEAAPGARHAIVAGTSYQFVRFDPYRSSLTLSIGTEHAHVFGAFVSDEITLTPTVKATLGAKVEHDSVTRSGLLPSAHIIWSVTDHQRVWASLARARRTPALTERSLRYYFGAVTTPEGPVILGYVRNPDFGVETLTQGSVGYRVRLGPNASLDIVGFYGEFNGLATTEPVAPVFMTAPAPGHVLVALHSEHLMDAATRGIEVSGEWSPAPALRLHGSYSLLRITPRVDASSVDAEARSFDANAPRAQWQAHASYRPAGTFRLDASVYRVGELRQLAVPAYTRADLRAEKQIAQRLWASAGVQNLFDRSHAEFTGITLGSALVPRSRHAQLRWSV